MARPKQKMVFAEVSINGRISRFVFTETEIKRLTSLGAQCTIIPEPDPLFEEPKKGGKK